MSLGRDLRRRHLCQFLWKGQVQYKEQQVAKALERHTGYRGIWAGMMGGFRKEMQ